LVSDPIILNAPALAVLNALERIGPYVVPGVDPVQPRHDFVDDGMFASR